MNERVLPQPDVYWADNIVQANAVASNMGLRVTDVAQAQIAKLIEHLIHTTQQRVTAEGWPMYRIIRSERYYEHRQEQIYTLVAFECPQFRRVEYANCRSGLRFPNDTHPHEQPIMVDARRLMYQQQPTYGLLHNEVLYVHWKGDSMSETRLQATASVPQAIFEAMMNYIGQFNHRPRFLLLGRTEYRQLRNDPVIQLNLVFDARTHTPTFEGMRVIEVSYESFFEVVG